MGRSRLFAVPVQIALPFEILLKFYPRQNSKQLGNSPDPLDLIAQFGADGMRVAMLLSSSAGNGAFTEMRAIDIRFSLRDHSEGLPYKFVGDSNDRHLAWLAVRPQTVETSLALCPKNV